MPAALAPAAPYLAVAALAWAYYRRIRRNFGRQRWQPLRSGLRLAVLGLALAGLGTAAAWLPHVAASVACGLLIGAGLGVLALRHTRAEWIDGAGWYTPNPWIGGGLTLLLLGRLAWRWSQGALAAGAYAANSQAGNVPAMPRASPLTLGIAATLVGYALVRGIGLFRRMHALRAANDGGKA